ncbi:hypothetical protein H1C71_002271 [Ictidomys tridecemlineatus]|nr:hypothetical protein H1C71_002271 [Ictidomys tridecemlineatus]
MRLGPCAGWKVPRCHILSHQLSFLTHKGRNVLSTNCPHYMKNHLGGYLLFICVSLVLVNIGDSMNVHCICLRVGALLYEQGSFLRTHCNLEDIAFYLPMV